MLVHFGEHCCKEDGHYVIAFPHEASATPPFQKFRFGKPRFQSCEETSHKQTPYMEEGAGSPAVIWWEPEGEVWKHHLFFFFKEGGASHLNPNNVLSHLIQYLNFPGRNFPWHAPFTSLKHSANLAALKKIFQRRRWGTSLKPHHRVDLGITSIDIDP